MMPPTLQQPIFEGSSFVCPNCDAYAYMSWSKLYAPSQEPQNYESYDSTSLHRATCAACDRFSLWNVKLADLYLPNQKDHIEMIYPNKVVAPAAHADMPDSCRAEFEEARQIARASPRGAAALLRLVLQHLCIELGTEGKDINHDIGVLVAKGLPEAVKDAMDSLRVIGNEAVHPGEMPKEAHAEHVTALFELVNFIVQQTIAQRKLIASIRAKLPPKKLDGIEQRDAKLLGSRSKTSAAT